jgi:prepilin-type N-terminal cleavage/methylation domain-containing protein
MGFTFLRNITGAVRRSRLDREHGFTLIEVMVSAAIVVLLAASVAKALIASTDFSGYERYRSQADEVAQQDQERLKSLSDAQLTDLDQTRAVVVGPTTYTLHSTATFLSSSGTSSCTSDSTAYFKVTSNVAWNATKGNPVSSITEETIITRPLGGSLVLKVNDQTGAGLSGVTVTPTGQSTKYTTNGVTDPTGCAAFAGLPIDGYTLKLADTGYVDPNGNPNPTEAASVNASGVTSAIPMIFGQAGSVKASFVTNDATSGATAVAVPGYELSYYGSGGGNQMNVFATTGSQSASATNLTATNLFPFALPGPTYTNNYQVWAGSCEQEEPLQPPSGTDTASVTPGVANAPGTVDEPAVDLAVTYNGSYVTPSDVYITFTGTSSAGTCTDEWKAVPQLTTETVSGVTYGVYPAPFASNATKGTATASSTGDPGSIVVCADYKNSGGTYYRQTSSSFENTNFTGPTFAPAMPDLYNGTGHLTGKCT